MNTRMNMNMNMSTKRRSTSTNTNRRNRNRKRRTNLETVGGEVGQDGEHEQRARPREEHNVRVQLARLRARLRHQLQLARVRRRAQCVHLLRTPFMRKIVYENSQKSTPTAHLLVQLHCGLDWQP